LPNRRTILIVEDDGAARNYLADALRLGGFNVETVGDGLAALRSVSERRPAAIVLDLDLPLMNGFAVHTALQQDERTRHIPIIVVTGTGLNSPVPVAATMSKPIPPDALVNVVFAALRDIAHEEPDTMRMVLWLCPKCGRVARETSEVGDPMTSEMRRDTAACAECAEPRAEGQAEG
jgi:CheY-like chemotaxis protein